MNSKLLKVAFSVMFALIGIFSAYHLAHSADPSIAPSAKEIEYRKCLAAVGPRQTWAPGSENCPDVIKTWRANNPKTTW